MRNMEEGEIQSFPEVYSNGTLEERSIAAQEGGKRGRELKGSILVVRSQEIPHSHTAQQASRKIFTGKDT